MASKLTFLMLVDVRGNILDIYCASVIVAVDKRRRKTLGQLALGNKRAVRVFLGV